MVGRRGKGSGHALATVCAGAAALAASCSTSGPSPRFDPVGDQVVGIGDELVVALHATHPDGADLSYDFSTSSGDLGDRAEITQRPGGSAEFRWRPVASDVGEWFFDFEVSDGSRSDETSVAVEVTASAGDAAPVFRDPVGTGTALHLDSESCVELDIVVDAPAAGDVDIAQEEPVLEGAELTQTGGLTAEWEWCPGAGQIAASSRHRLTLSADDGESPKARKHYLIVLDDEEDPDCEGEQPAIEHTAGDVDTVDEVAITAVIDAAEGLKESPILFYTDEEPSEPPSLAAMNPIEMELVDGDRSFGEWMAEVPNPVADDGEGSAEDLYYVITATGSRTNDKTCGQLLQNPEGSSHQITVTNSGGSGTHGLCQACSADAQCSGEADYCTQVAGTTQATCLASCEDDPCPSGYVCSANPITSVSGRTAFQCIPEGGSCAESAAQCTDDDFAPNYGPGQAAALEEGEYPDLVMCPRDDGYLGENWFTIETSGDELVSLELSGGDHTDLDLWLLDPYGGVVDRSINFDSQEDILTCLPEGGYYAVVNEAWLNEENPYLLSYHSTSADCADYCTPDDYGPDDDFSQAREVDLTFDSYLAEDNKICPGESDFYAIELFDGETMAALAAFEQTSILDDLDFRFYDEDQNVLTPCSEEEPELCDPDHGQSSTSDEYFEYTVEDAGCTPCTFYLEVWGFGDASNEYDILIELADAGG